MAWSKCECVSISCLVFVHRWWIYSTSREDKVNTTKCINLNELWKFVCLKKGKVQAHNDNSCMKKRVDKVNGKTSTIQVTTCPLSRMIWQTSIWIETHCQKINLSLQKNGKKLRIEKKKQTKYLVKKPKTTESHRQPKTKNHTKMDTNWIQYILVLVTVFHSIRKLQYTQVFVLILKLCAIWFHYSNDAVGCSSQGAECAFVDACHISRLLRFMLVWLTFLLHFLGIYCSE